MMTPTFLISFSTLESNGNKRELYSGCGSGRASTATAPTIMLLARETKMLAVHFKKKVAVDAGAVALKDDLVVGDFGAEMLMFDESDNNADRAGLTGLANASGSQGLFAAAGSSPHRRPENVSGRNRGGSGEERPAGPALLAGVVPSPITWRPIAKLRSVLRRAGVGGWFVGLCLSGRRERERL